MEEDELSNTPKTATQEDSSSDEDTSSINSEWLMSDDSAEQELEAAAAAAPDQRTLERCVDTARMFKLRRALGQLDLYHQQKEQDVQTARMSLNTSKHSQDSGFLCFSFIRQEPHRNKKYDHVQEQQRACREHIEELLERREKLEEEMEIQRAADNSAGLFRLRAQHRKLCEELRREEELELLIRDTLQKHQLELCEAEVELGKVSSLRREVQKEEQSFSLQKRQLATRRLQQEKQTCANLLSRAHRNNERKEKEGGVFNQFRSHTCTTQALTHQRLHSCLLSILSATIKKTTLLKESFFSEREQTYHGNYELKESNPHLEKRPSDRTVKKRSKIALKKISETAKPQKVNCDRSRDHLFVITMKSPPSRLQNIVALKAIVHPVVHNLGVSCDNAHQKLYQDSSDSEDTSDPEDQQQQQEEDQEDRAADLEQPEFCGMWAHHYKAQQTQEDSKKSALAQTEVAQSKCTAPNENSSAKKVPTKDKRGPPFSSKPELLHFKDFEVKQVYKKKVILTNVSYSTNVCRLVGVSASLKSCVSVSFEPPGSLSTGMSCELLVVFEPQVNEDVEGEIRFASATGPFSVPVRCCTKKCQMEVDCSFIDFGSQVVGQAVTRCFTLTNRGALGCDFRLDMSDENGPENRSSLQPSCGPADATQESDNAQAEENDEKKQESSVQPDSKTLLTDQLSSDPSHSTHSLHPRDSAHSHVTDLSHYAADLSDATCDVQFGSVTEGHVGPFQSAKLDVIFKSTIPGETTLTFYIHFSDTSSQTIPVQVKASAVSVPVWVSHPNVDLKICLWDQQYHHSICVHSRASTALKLTFEVCPELKKHMEVVPKTGFVQAQSSFKALLRFQPRASLPEDAGVLFDRDTGVLEAPVEVHAAGQWVSLTVSAVLTSSDLSLDTSLLDFGSCSIHQAVRSRVQLTNMSLLPQDFGFCDLPEFVEVQPNDGFGTLLPQETLNVDLIFRPKKAQVYSFQLCCKTGLNRDLWLSCRAVAVRPPLELSHSAVRFGDTALGHGSSALVRIVNTERPQSPAKPRLFSFHVPDQSEVSVSPPAGRLLPGESTVVQLTFRPSPQDTQTEAECPRQDQVQDQVQDKTESKTRPSPNVHDPKKAASRHPINTLYLKLQCPVIQPPLVVTSGSGGNSVDFHNITVGERAVQRCVIQNVSEESLQVSFYRVRMSCVTSLFSFPDPAPVVFLCPVCGRSFSVLNALRSLTPGQSHTLLLKFCPSRALKYRERLELSSHRGALWLTLCGEGVLPEVTCSPCGPELDFGHVLVKESSTHTLKLQNRSQVEVSFRTRLSSLSPPAPAQDGTPALLLTGRPGAGSSAFCVVPAEGRLAPGHSQDLRVSFQPKEEQQFRARLTVQLSNQSAVCVTELQGAACTRSMFVSGGDPLNRLSAHASAGDPEGPGPNSTDQRELQVGFVRSTLSNKKSAEFVWDNVGSVQQQGFNIEPSRGAVEQGSSRTVTVTWTPPRGYKYEPHDVVQSCVALTLKADAVRVYSVTLLALVTPPPTADL
ncbi:hypothetical protein WMY93_027481 [Mugilogobius chulae]|uniref:MSP domain-containing protein n=1 Tax=Mugilogobius chulae TaxID=88201 RepID=A0AAW0N394_9GOBI